MYSTSLMLTPTNDLGNGQTCKFSQFAEENGIDERPGSIIAYVNTSISRSKWLLHEHLPRAFMFDDREIYAVKAHNPLMSLVLADFSTTIKGKYLQGYVFFECYKSEQHFKR